MLLPIIEKLDNDFLKLLNKFIKRIGFIDKEKPIRPHKKGILIDECFEYNFHSHHLIFFLNIIFEKAYYRWVKSHSGALRRYIWESFYREFINTLVDISRLNSNLIQTAKTWDLNKKGEETQKLKELLFSNSGTNIATSISLRTDLSNEEIPKSLGFLDILYNKKLDELKVKLTRRLMTNNLKIKYYNELRKLKLNYRYEYTLSELVNYCIHSDHFKSFFRYNRSREVKQEYYKTAENLIIEFLEKYDFKLKKYTDSVNCTHYFLTHKIFERIKSVCLQICVQKIRIDSLEHYKKFKEFYSKCPICEKEDINQINCEMFYFSEKFHYFKETLISAMNQYDSFEKLNNNDNFFGIPCEECFYLARNIQGNKSDLKNLEKFLEEYKTCPVCLNKNHKDYLISFFYDKSKKNLRDSLIKNMNSANACQSQFNYNIAIPCCKCYEEIFGEKPDFLNHYY